MTQSTPPGWYPDGQGGQRWWDGNQWTEHTLPPPEPADRPAAPEQPAQPAPSDVTQVRPPAGAPEQPAVDRPAAPEAAQPPASLPTQVAGPGTAGHPAQPGYPAAPQQGYGQQPGYVAPQQGYPGQPGQPGQPAWQGQQFAGGSGGGGMNLKLIGLIAGGAVALIVLVVVVFMFIGGGSPKGVVEDFLDAESCSDVEDLVTDDFFGDAGCSDSDVDPDAALGDDVDVDYDIGDEEIDGDKATVKVTQKVDFDGDEQEFKYTFNLVKEDGDWKIEDFS